MNKRLILGIITLILVVTGTLVVKATFFTAPKIQNCCTGDMKEKAIIADWKTYTNEKYGVEFKYPKDFTVNVINEVDSLFEVSIDTPYYNPPSTLYNLHFHVTALSETDNLACISKPYGKESQSKMTSEEMVRNGDTFQNIKLKEVSSYSTTSNEERYHILKNNYCYMIVKRIYYQNEEKSGFDYSTYQSILDSIFSTFKFTK